MKSFRIVAAIAVLLGTVALDSAVVGANANFQPKSTEMPRHRCFRTSTMRPSLALMRK